VKKRIAKPNRPQLIKERLTEENPDALLADGFDNALIGVCRRCTQPPLAAYDYEKVAQSLMNDGMSYEDAVEFIEFNIVGAWMGEHTPIFVEVVR
jgi:hypothetical protein